MPIAAENIPTGRSPIRPGDLPSEEYLCQEPLLRHLEENPVFIALLANFREMGRAWGTEFFSPSTLWLARALCGWVLIGAVPVGFPIILLRLDLIRGSRDAQTWLLWSLRWGPIMTMIGGIFFLPLFIGKRKPFGRRGRLAKLGLPETLMRSLTEDPEGPRLFATAWWGIAAGQRRVRFLRIVTFGMLATYWMVALGEVVLDPARSTRLPLVTVLSFIWTLTLAASWTGPHAALLGVRPQGFAEVWRRPWATRAQTLIFGLIRRPGDLLFVTVLPVGVLALIKALEPVVIGPPGSDYFPPPSRLETMIWGPLLPLALGTIAGAYCGVKTGRSARGNCASLMRDAETRISKELEELTGGIPPGTIRDA